MRTCTHSTVCCSGDSSLSHTPAPPLPRYTSPMPSFSGVGPSTRHTGGDTPTSALGWARESAGTPAITAAAAAAAATAAAASAVGSEAGQKELRNEIASLQVGDSYCCCCLVTESVFLSHSLSVEDPCPAVESLSEGRNPDEHQHTMLNSVKVVFWCFVRPMMDTKIFWMNQGKVDIASKCELTEYQLSRARATAE
jgi:hypothetical protein